MLLSVVRVVLIENVLMFVECVVDIVDIVCGGLMKKNGI